MIGLAVGRRTLVMGILNQTPDSFSGDGLDDDIDAAVARAESIRRATAAGVRRTSLIADPGLGFAKLPPISLEVLRRLPELRSRLGLPVLIGASRKGFIGRVLDAPVDDRLEGSMATVALAIAGGAEIVRVHDVGPSVRVARMSDVIARGLAD